MKKKRLLTYILAAALATVQPVCAYADTQISLVGPSGETNQNTNNSYTSPAGNNTNTTNNTNPTNNTTAANTANGLPMAGTNGSTGTTNTMTNQSPGGGSSTANTNQIPGSNNTNNTASGSQVPGAGNPGGEQNTSSAQNPGTGSTGAAPSNGPASFYQQNQNQNQNTSSNPSSNPGGSSSPNSSTQTSQTVRDGSTPEKALLYYTDTYKKEEGTLKTPTVQAEGAYLLNASTGEVLFEKNGNSTFYPASITKIMTALLVLEKCNLDSVVTYHASSAYNLESGAVKLGLAEGDQMTVRDSLYAILLKSANDVAAGLAEYVGGSQAGFAQMMNERAKAIGCTGTNFTNPHGLNDTNHYTTPHDMALIAAEAFKNTTLCQINSTLSYKLPATKSVTTERTITLGHKMFFKNDSRYYEGIIGGKTGYTSKAGNTLVSCVERDGERLVAVVLKSSQTHYQDTKAMLDYGFSYLKQKKMGSQNAAFGTWKQNEYGWYFVNENGNFVKSIWMEINDQIYLFDGDGYMATGWKQVNGKSWYYFGASGAMKKGCWVQTNNQWYYLSDDGSLFTNGVTPDGYTVNEYGIWQQ